MAASPGSHPSHLAGVRLVIEPNSPRLAYCRLPSQSHRPVPQLELEHLAGAVAGEFVDCADLYEYADEKVAPAMAQVSVIG